MALVPRTKVDLAVEELENFDMVFRELYSTHGWRLFVKQVENRRMAHIGSLTSEEVNLDQRSEDKLRGRINECNFILALDTHAKILNEESKNGSRREADRDY